MIAFCVGWLCSILFTWLLLNKFDSSGAFSSIFFSKRSTQHSNFDFVNENAQETLNELDDIVRKTHALLKEIQDEQKRAEKRNKEISFEANKVQRKQVPNKQSVSLQTKQSINNNNANNSNNNIIIKKQHNNNNNNLTFAQKTHLSQSQPIKQERKQSLNINTNNSSNNNKVVMLNSTANSSVMNSMPNLPSPSISSTSPSTPPTPPSFKKNFNALKTSSNPSLDFESIKEGTVLIRKDNKWQKFYGVLTSSSFNILYSKQTQLLITKIIFSPFIDVQKLPSNGCVSLLHKNKEPILEKMEVSEEYPQIIEFLHFHSQSSSCILRFKTDEDAEDWIAQITNVMNNIKQIEELELSDDDHLFSSDEDEPDLFADDREDVDIKEEKEKEDVFLAAKNSHEKKALAVFIKALKSAYNPDEHDGYMLMRFLRARQLNVPKAIAMFTNYLNWRKEFKPDMITKEMISSEIRKKKGYFHYFDKMKHPNLIVLVGKHNQRDSDLQTMLNFLVYIIETAIKFMPKNVERFSAIIDCTNLSVNQVDFPLVKEGLSILQNYYPERLGGVYITNYPMLFQVVWKVIKPLLDNRTSEKIRFCTPKELLEFFEPRYLPVRLGGTSKFEETDYETGLETLQAAN